MTVLSKGMKQRIRAAANFPRYGAVGLHDPQQEIDVWLRGLAEPLEVTGNNVIAALRPFTLGIMLKREHPTIPEGQSVQLCMHEAGGAKRLLGTIHMTFVRTIALPQHRFCLFETSRCENFCVAALSQRLYDLREAWKAEIRQRRNRYNFLMTQEGIRCSHVFYICPRPVVLVTVEHEGAGNIFPMDLIGPTDSPWYSMALRSTSPAVRLMQQSGRMALASVPLSRKDAAYELGKHHKKTSIDWKELPFPTVASPCFGLHVPEAALRVREVQVQEFHEVGSHVLFITSIQRETVRRQIPDGEDGRQLFHQYSSYREYLRQQGIV